MEEEDGVEKRTVAGVCVSECRLFVAEDPTRHQRPVAD